MRIPDKGLYLVGLVLMVLVKIRTHLKGYTRPKPFTTEKDEARCVKYDMSVVRQWSSLYERYSGVSEWVKGKSVLELGPGADLGTGIILLASGARKYSAVDINNLASGVSSSLYTSILEELEKDRGFAHLHIARQVVGALGRKESTPRLEYHFDSEFDLSKLACDDGFDLVLSQAAFEHFSDIYSTISKLSPLVNAGGRLVVTVDLMTHTRWIREIDPNNIYRYPSWLYNIFRYPGVPNRKRPYSYVDALGLNGWVDISVIPLQTLSDYGVGGGRVCKLDTQFEDEKNQMEFLEVAILATKAGAELAGK